MDIYEDLLQSMKGLRNAEEETSGLDEFLSPSKEATILPDKMKVASLGDLSAFFRVSCDTLVHKAEKDLWRISEDKNGGVIVERLFDPDTKQAIRV